MRPAVDRSYKIKLPRGSSFIFNNAISLTASAAVSTATMSASAAAAASRAAAESSTTASGAAGIATTMECIARIAKATLYRIIQSSAKITSLPALYCPTIAKDTASPCIAAIAQKATSACIVAIAHIALVVGDATLCVVVAHVTQVVRGGNGTQMTRVAGQAQPVATGMGYTNRVGTSCSRTKTPIASRAIPTLISTIKAVPVAAVVAAIPSPIHRVVPAAIKSGISEPGIPAPIR